MGNKKAYMYRCSHNLALIRSAVAVMAAAAASAAVASVAAVADAAFAAAAVAVASVAVVQNDHILFQSNFG